VTESAGISGEAQSHSATWWDFDNDGWPDLYVANDYGVPDKLYHNNRDGTFTNVIDRVLPHTSSFSMGSDLGDVNNDGLIDLLVADMAATTHQKDQRTMAGEREGKGTRRPRRPSTTAAPSSEHRRRAAASRRPTSRASPPPTGPGRVRLEDLDNDGRLDLFVTNGFNRDPESDVIRRAGLAASQTERIKDPVRQPGAGRNPPRLPQPGRPEIRERQRRMGPQPEGGELRGSAFGDLNGDGNLDVVYTNYEGA
jgi:enediyne biosynthesis protein E4